MSTARFLLYVAVFYACVVLAWSYSGDFRADVLSAVQAFADAVPPSFR